MWIFFSFPFLSCSCYAVLLSPTSLSLSPSVSLLSLLLFFHSMWLHLSSSHLTLISVRSLVVFQTAVDQSVSMYLSLMQHLSCYLCISRALCASLHISPIYLYHRSELNRLFIKVVSSSYWQRFYYVIVISIIAPRHTPPVSLCVVCLLYAYVMHLRIPSKLSSLRVSLPFPFWTRLLSSITIASSLMDSTECCIRIMCSHFCRVTFKG